MLTEQQQLEQVIAAAMKGDLQATIAASLTKVLNERDARKAKQDQDDAAVAASAMLLSFFTALVMLGLWWALLDFWPLPPLF